MTPALETEIRALIEAQRARALWSWPLDYFPPDVDAAKAVLNRIAARGDRETFVAARRLLKQLS